MTPDHAMTDLLDGVIVRTPQGNEELRHRRCAGTDVVVKEQPALVTLPGCDRRCKRCTDEVPFVGDGDE